VSNFQGEFGHREQQLFGQFQNWQASQNTYALTPVPRLDSRMQCQPNDIAYSSLLVQNTTLSSVTEGTVSTKPANRQHFFALAIFSPNLLSHPDVKTRHALSQINDLGYSILCNLKTPLASLLKGSV
jgi:hypothetical protein